MNQSFRPFSSCIAAALVPALAYRDDKANMAQLSVSWQNHVALS
jgi:hypothetical protein